MRNQLGGPGFRFRGFAQLGGLNKMLNVAWPHIRKADPKFHIVVMEVEERKLTIEIIGTTGKEIFGWHSNQYQAILFRTWQAAGMHGYSLNYESMHKHLVQLSLNI